MPNTQQHLVVKKRWNRRRVRSVDEVCLRFRFCTAKYVWSRQKHSERKMILQTLYALWTRPGTLILIGSHSCYRMLSRKRRVLYSKTHDEYVIFASDESSQRALYSKTPNNTRKQQNCTIQIDSKMVRYSAPGTLILIGTHSCEGPPFMANDHIRSEAHTVWLTSFQRKESGPGVAAKL